MNVENLFIATVINNNDKTQEGRVQIKVDSIMSGWIPTHYPWARQFALGGGGTNLHGVSFIPEMASKIWVFCEKPDLKDNWYYLADVNLKTNNPHKQFQTQVKAKVQSPSTYPNTKFIFFKNGICIAIDSSIQNPEIVIYHTKGSSLVFKSTGDIEVKPGIGNIFKLGKLPINFVNNFPSCLFTGAPHSTSTDVMA